MTATIRFHDTMGARRMLARHLRTVFLAAARRDGHPIEEIGDDGDPTYASAALDSLCDEVAEAALPWTMGDARREMLHDGRPTPWTCACGRWNAPHVVLCNACEQPDPVRTMA